MRKALAVALSLAALVLVASPAAAQAPADLRAAMAARDSAIATGDAAAWDQLTAAAFTVVQEDGVMMTRAERLTQFKAQKPSGFAPRTREIVTRLGDVYVARYLRGSVWILDVWTREGGRWKVAAVQVTTAKK